MSATAYRFHGLDLAAWMRRKLAAEMRSANWLTRRVARSRLGEVVALIRSIQHHYPRPRLP
mgnify:CR=1 FL=1